VPLCVSLYFVLEELERHVQKIESKRLGVSAEVYRLMVIANIWWMSDKALEFNAIDEIVVENV